MHTCHDDGLFRHTSLFLRKRKPTQWIDLQVGEEEVLIQVEEPDDEAGQDPAERRHSTH